MERLLYGGLDECGIEVVERFGRRYVRYDVGAHQIRMREDEITPEEFQLIIAGGRELQRGILQMQARLRAKGIDANTSNWRPEDEA